MQEVADAVLGFPGALEGRPRTVFLLCHFSLPRPSCPIVLVLSNFALSFELNVSKGVTCMCD